MVYSAYTSFHQLVLHDQSKLIVIHHTCINGKSLCLGVKIHCVAISGLASCTCAWGCPWFTTPVMTMWPWCMIDLTRRETLAHHSTLKRGQVSYLRAHVGTHYRVYGTWILPVIHDPYCNSVFTSILYLVTQAVSWFIWVHIVEPVSTFLNNFNGWCLLNCTRSAKHGQHTFLDKCKCWLYLKQSKLNMMN